MRLKSVSVLVLLLSTLHGISVGHYDSGTCGTCVCNPPPTPNIGPESLAQGKPGKKGPPGPPGEPGIPDDTVVERELDKKFRNFEEKMAKLENMLNTQAESIEKLLRLQQQIDCASVQGPSGVYEVYPEGYKEGLEVYCDHDIDDGRWTVIQRRMDGSVDFYRGWDEYVSGFGSLTGEFWIGLEKLHRLTKSGSQELRVDLEDMEGNKAYAKYSLFQVDGASTDYTLKASGFSGSAGDGLAHHNGHKFTTKDKDHDANAQNCAATYTGAWWYGSCHHANLNGKYYNHADTSAKGVSWYKWYTDHRSMKHVEMKIRSR